MLIFGQALISKLNGEFDEEFLDINIVVYGEEINVNLLEVDRIFGDQFKKNFNYDRFPEGLKDGSYNPDGDIMNEIRNLFATGISKLKLK